MNAPFSAPVGASSTITFRWTSTPSDGIPKRTRHLLQSATGPWRSDPINYVNIIGSITGPRSFLVRGQQVTGVFAPRGLTYNMQSSNTGFRRLVQLRADLLG